MVHLNIAIVEDEKEMFEKLRDLLTAYFGEKGISFFVDYYSCGESFLHKYKADYDLVFMDINLPGANGMETIKKLRERDPDVLVIFITYLAQFAIDGYSVGAFDYILKPFNDKNLFVALDRALCNLNRFSVKIQIGNSNRAFGKMIPIDSIKYVESVNHRLNFHLSNGEMRVNGSLKKYAEQLKQYCFEPCSVSFLVNLKYITSIEGNVVRMGNNGNDVAFISRGKRAEFLEAVNKYFGNGGGR